MPWTGKARSHRAAALGHCWRWQTHITLQDSTLAAVINKLLSASSQERYSTAQEALSALTSGLGSAPAQQTTSGPAVVSARPPATTTSGPKPGKPRPWILGLVLLAILAAGGSWWWFRKEWAKSPPAPCRSLWPPLPPETECPMLGGRSLVT